MPVLEERIQLISISFRLQGLNWIVFHHKSLLKYIVAKMATRGFQNGLHVFTPGFWMIEAAVP